MTHNIKNIVKFDDADIYTVEYEHPTLGWIPFTAKADDVEELGREIHAQCSKRKKFKTERLGLEDYDARQWRNEELKRADVELLKAEDGDGIGEPQEWRAYRKALRAWPTADGFPAIESRPKAPDHVEE